MRPNLLSRFLLVVAACALSGAVASDAFAQTQQLNKTLERKFPEGICPIDTELIGTFVTATGHIQLSFETQNGYDDAGTFIFHQQRLDDVIVMELSKFNALKVLRDFCYFDGEINALPVGYAPSGDPQVPFYEPFFPLTSACDWDETNGATVDAAEGNIKLGSVGAGPSTVGTSVVISGLTPGVQYVICAEWHSVEFTLPDDCSPREICMAVTVDDLPNGCGPVPVQSTTWGKVKSLYTR